MIFTGMTTHSSMQTVGHAAAAKSLQSCPTLCDPRDGSPPDSPVPEILQARTLEWVAIFFSNAWKWKVKVMSLGLIRLFVTPWTAAYQAPPSMEFSRQENWNGVSLPSPGSYVRRCLKDPSSRNTPFPQHGIAAVLLPFTFRIYNPSLLGIILPCLFSPEA